MFSFISKLFYPAGRNILLREILASVPKSPQRSGSVLVRLQDRKTALHGIRCGSLPSKEEVEDIIRTAVSIIECHGMTVFDMQCRSGQGFTEVYLAYVPRALPHRHPPRPA